MRDTGINAYAIVGYTQREVLAVGELDLQFAGGRVHTGVADKEPRTPPMKSRIAAVRVISTDCWSSRPLSLSTAAEIVSRWTSSPMYLILSI
jgi:hypothetical protein